MPQQVCAVCRVLGGVGILGLVCRSLCASFSFAGSSFFFFLSSLLSDCSAMRLGCLMSVGAVHLYRVCVDRVPLFLPCSVQHLGLRVPLLSRMRIGLRTTQCWQRSLGFGMTSRAARFVRCTQQRARLCFACCLFVSCWWGGCARGADGHHGDRVLTLDNVVAW